MKKTSSIFILMIITGIIISCKKEKVEVQPSIPRDTLNYDQDEQSLINSGWTKVYQEDFNSDFSNWNIWQGGAYNNEYQYYSNSFYKLFQI